MKRTLHLTFSLDFGGVESHLQTIAEHGGLAYRHTFAAIAGGGRAAKEIGRNAECHVFGANPWRRPIGTFRRLLQYFRRERFEVVHCHGAEANLFGLWAAYLAGVPVRVGEEIGIPDHNLRASIAYRIAYAAADHVIGVSSIVRDFLVARGEVPACKTVVVYNPVRRLAAEPAQRRDGEPLRLVFIGRLEDVKNPLAALEAVERVVARGHDVQLTFVGDGALRASLAERIESAKLESRVLLAGFQADPAPYFADAHVLIQPSISEGFGIAVAEGLSVGLPALVTAGGGMSEIVENEANGWVVDRNEPSALADRLAQIERLPTGELAAFGARARASMKNRFGIDRYIEKVEALYESVR